jgi:hypothetical protein
MRKSISPCQVIHRSRSGSTLTQQLKDLIESGYDLNDYAEEKELVGARPRP